MDMPHEHAAWTCLMDMHIDMGMPEYTTLQELNKI
jgi:hypothetical protein